jgi:hypothetical protein
MHNIILTPKVPPNVYLLIVRDYILLEDWEKIRILGPSRFWEGSNTVYSFQMPLHVSL